MNIPVITRRTRWQHDGPVTVTVSVCCICKRAVKDTKPWGEPLPLRWGQSHTWCAECYPKWLAGCGVTQAVSQAA